MLLNSDGYQIVCVVFVHNYFHILAVAPILANRPIGCDVASRVQNSLSYLHNIPSLGGISDSSIHFTKGCKLEPLKY